MRCQLFVSVFGDNEAVTDLGAESLGDADRAVDCQHHAGLQDCLVTGDQLRFFQKAEPGRPATAERILVTRALDHLGIGRMDLFSGDTGAENAQRGGLAVDGTW